MVGPSSSWSTYPSLTPVGLEALTDGIGDVGLCGGATIGGCDGMRSEGDSDCDGENQR